MTSQSLYRKWRSQTFDDLVGQEPIVETLKNELKIGNLSHAYLFTGPRGTGKTSTARLLAKTVNCEHPRDGEPCNQCAQCREITAGSSFNVIEIDAASNRGIDNIRELRERIMVPPASGKYKVYVLDEAHMLTAEAFNALLKTLEEPPDYAIFVLATTDVHKMLPTVISRCQRFDFKRITTRRIVEHLNYIAGQEGVTLERAASELIARAAAGGLRDALSLLDQAIAYAGSEIALAQVQAMLGVADPHAISKFVTSVAGLDGSAVLHLINDLSEAGADLRQVNIQVMEYWRALMLTRAGADTAGILDLTGDEMQEIRQLAGQFSLEELTECARIFAQNELAQKNQGTPQLGLELAALDCIEAHRRAQSGQPGHAVHTGASMRVQDDRAARGDVVATGRDMPERPLRPSLPVTPPAQDGRPMSPTPQVSADQAGGMSNAGSARPSLTVLQVARAWDNVRKRAKQKSALLATYMAFFEVVAIEGTAEQPVVVMRAVKATHLKNLKDANRNKDLEWALQVEFNLPSCQVRLLSPDQSPTIADPPQSYSASAAPSATQQSAYRESPAIPAPPAPSSESPADVPRDEQQTDAAPANHAAGNSGGVSNLAGLARMNVIRENRQGAIEETLEQKARRDPVVQEVIRTFTAKIVDIHPK
jgi:DNA polymerase III subunit gamma/tau